MKSVVAALLSLFAGSALGQYYNVTSKPFHLVTHSHDEKYDGTYLFACHEGAAIEGLCLGSKNVTDASPFRFNTSSYEQDFNKTLGQTGWLTYLLVGGNFERALHSLRLCYGSC